MGGQLRPQYLPPGEHPLNQGPHAQLAGDGQGLVQQGHGLLSVAWLVPLEQRVGVVAAGPGKLEALGPLLHHRSLTCPRNRSARSLHAHREN